MKPTPRVQAMIDLARQNAARFGWPADRLEKVLAAILDPGGRNYQPEMTKYPSGESKSAKVATAKEPTRVMSVAEDLPECLR